MVDRRGTAVAWGLLALLGPGVWVGSAEAQAPDAEGSNAWTVAGGALGLTAGALVGNVGSILPCTQTPLGARCVGAATLVGGGVGLTSGLIVGGSAHEIVRRRATTALVGMGVGTAVGLVGRPFLQRVGLTDVFIVGAVGGAIGTQPKGALIGFAVGTVLGATLWQLVPGIGSPDVVAGSIAGVMVGVLTAWVSDAVEARRSDPGAVPIFSITLPR